MIQPGDIATVRHSFNCQTTGQRGAVEGQRVRVMRVFNVKTRGETDANASVHGSFSPREARSGGDSAGGAGGVLVQQEAAEVQDLQAADSREEPRRGQSPQGGGGGEGLVTTSERVAVADPETCEVLHCQVPVEWLREGENDG